jgi:release factor glutamine methyltransferase
MFSTPLVCDDSQVYPPAEDSYLMLDALQNDLLPATSFMLAVDVGCGSGIISSFLAKHFRMNVIAVDLNCAATNTTLRTAQRNCVHLDAVTGDLFSFFAHPHYIDLVVFNPPYVLTPSEEVGSKDISASWAGGINGREVIDKFIKQSKTLTNAIIYLLLLNENDPKDVCEKMKEIGFDSRMVIYRKCGIEGLSVYCFKRP